MGVYGSLGESVTGYVVRVSLGLSPCAVHQVSYVETNGMLKV